MSAEIIPLATEDDRAWQRYRLAIFSFVPGITAEFAESLERAFRASPENDDDLVARIRPKAVE